MNFNFRLGEIGLRHNQPISLDKAQGTRLICTEGTLWVTVTGEGCDIFLKAGDAYRVRGNGRVLIESLGTAKLRLVTPEQHTLWQKLGDWLDQAKSGAGALSG